MCKNFPHLSGVLLRGSEPLAVRFLSAT